MDRTTGQRVWRTLTLMSGMTCGAAAGSCTDRTEPASPSTCPGLISFPLLSPHWIHTHVLSPLLYSIFIATFSPYSCPWFQLMANIRAKSGDHAAWPSNATVHIYKKPTNRIFLFFKKKIKKLLFLRMLLCHQILTYLQLSSNSSKFPKKNALKT